MRAFLIDAESSYPFGVYDASESFGEEVGRVFGSWDVVYVNEAAVDRVTNEMCADVDMFHPRVGLWVVTA
jgi:hypothetical protein